MKLSTLSIGLGLLLAVPHVFGLLKPAAFANAVRKFPRSEPWGYVLMGLGTLWFLGNLMAESISDFAAYKNVMLLGFGALGLLTCLYVRDFIAVRGLAVVLLLVSKLILDTARWHDSPWRVLLAAMAYVWILAGIWFIISPWRLRDLINWASASEARVRLASALRLAMGVFLIGLGMFVF